jgi:hypothetical protein
MGFKEDLAAAKAKGHRTEDVTVELNGKKYKLRFTQMDGTEWSAETLKHPMRLDVKFDTTFGYNINTLTRAVAPKTGELVVGKGTEPVEDWDDLFATISGGEITAITNCIYALNEFATAKAVDAARKALSALPAN